MSNMDPGIAVQLAPDVVRVIAPNPSVMTGPGTNTYLVGSRDLAVIDPGPDDARHLDVVAAAGEGRIRYVLVTHTHPDHAPGAKGLAERTGATVLGFGARDGFEPDSTLAEGDVVAGDGFRLRAMHTPGHASNHLCYLFEDRALLFTGDHVMGGSTVVISPPDGDMTQYLTSLELLLGFDPPIEAIAPGHGPVLEDPRAEIEAVLAHRRAREQAVLAALADRGQATVDELVTAVYVDVNPAMHPIARRSMWAHLRKLGSEAMAYSEHPEDIEATWVAQA